MTRTFRTSRLAVSLAGAALATVALAPGATAIPYEDLRSPNTRDAAARRAIRRVLCRVRPRSRLWPATRPRTCARLTPGTLPRATARRPLRSRPWTRCPHRTAFDWTSAAIGAGAGAGLLFILIAAFAGTGKLGRRSIAARDQSTASA